MRSDYEYKLSCATAEYLDLKGLVYTHFPAGEYRPAKVGAKLKRMGMQPGVPDYLIFSPIFIEQTFSFYSGLAIELKSPTARLSKAQQRWRHNLESCDWLYIVCRTIHEVAETVEEHYG